MKKFLAMALAAVLALSLVACGGGDSSDSASQSGESQSAEATNKLEQIKQQGYITVAISPDFGPYEFIDSTKTGVDQVVGCEVEFAKYVAEYLGVELRIEQMDFSTCQAAVSTGKVDFSTSGYAKTPEREETMGISDYYVWEEDDGDPEQVVIVLKSEAENYKTAEDFADKKVAAQNGSLQWNLVKEQLGKAEEEIEPVSSLADGIMLVISGKVDALACAYDTALQYCDNYDEITVPSFAFEYESQGNVALVQKGQDELLGAINEAIRKANEEGKFVEWYKDAVQLAKDLNVDI